MIPVPQVRIDFTRPDGDRWQRCLGDFRCIIEAQTLATVKPALERLERAVRAGAEAVGWIAYEAAPAFDPTLLVRPPDARLPLLWFGIDGREVTTTKPKHLAEFGTWEAAVNADAYTEVFTRIQAALAAGNTYQTNYTFGLETTFAGDPAWLYETLCKAQQSGYSAWFHHPDRDIISVSPELFFARRGTHILVRPMKGTRKRGLTLAEDRSIAAELGNASKDRAENIMIVDLLRSDLNRIAETAGVTVSTLFALERYPTVWQMTSTVEARLPAHTRLTSILDALFPCGSVTGAPKASTMRLIAREESAPRGVYCGAIGYMTRRETVFSVAIRTLTLIGDKARYPVGSGLVADSVGSEEYTECLAKAQVLAQVGLADFQLLETLLHNPEAGFFLLDRHLTRLAESAEYFGFDYEREAISQQLETAVSHCPAASRIRLRLFPDGRCAIEVEPRAGSLPPARIALAAAPVARNDPFLYHKTTHRRVYDRARATRPDAEDVVLFNENGEVTETSTANLAIERGGHWVTPAINSGLLGGTMRAELLARDQIIEGTIGVAEIRLAPRIRLFNSVRGIWEVTLLE